MTFFLVHICLIFLPKTKRKVKTLLEWADPLLSKKWSRLGDTPKKTVMTTCAPVVLLGAIKFFIKDTFKESNHQCFHSLTS